MQKGDVICGGITDFLVKIPGLDISSEGGLGLIGFTLSGVLLFGVSFLSLKMSSLRGTK